MILPGELAKRSMSVEAGQVYRYRDTTELVVLTLERVLSSSYAEAWSCLVLGGNPALGPVGRLPTVGSVRLYSLEDRWERVS